MENSSVCHSGNALLVYPVTEPKATSVNVFLPGSQEVRIADTFFFEVYLRAQPDGTVQLGMEPIIRFPVF